MAEDPTIDRHLKAIGDNHGNVPSLRCRTLVHCRSCAMPSVTGVTRLWPDAQALQYPIVAEAKAQSMPVAAE